MLFVGPAGLHGRGASRWVRVFGDCSPQTPVLFPIVADCAFICAILYQGLRHPWVWGTRVGVLEPRPLRYQGQRKVWDSQKLCRFIWGGRAVSTPYPSAVQRPTALYKKLDSPNPSWLLKGKSRVARGPGLSRRSQRGLEPGAPLGSLGSCAGIGRGGPSVYLTRRDLGASAGQQ